MAKKVFVAMSGGVDSTVAAALLLDMGYEVCGVNFVLEYGADSSLDAQKAAEQLGIELYVLDLREKFKEEIIDYFAAEYKAGRTPNPCVMCNKKIKFGKFFDFAKEKGADFIATGHYAKVERRGDEFILKKADNLLKDQSYVLYNLNQEILSKTLFPLSEFSKEEIRKIAEEKGISAANKPDSQDICFIPDGDYVKFLKENCGFCDKEGNFLDDEGNAIGKHSGAYRFTIGQRKGLGVSFGKPMFVTKICAENNEVTLSPGGMEYFSSLVAEEVSFISEKAPKDEIVVDVKTRYSAKPVSCMLKMTDDKKAELTFSQPIRAVAPGQSAVFYDGDVLLGGGVIHRAERIKII